MVELGFLVHCLGRVLRLRINDQNVRAEYKKSIDRQSTVSYHQFTGNLVFNHS